MFNIITRRTLLWYCSLYPQAGDALKQWYSELVTADFKNWNDLKSRYPNASIIADNRVIFNILGNEYRLIVRILFQFKSLQIKWFGTHAEYDRIDARTVNRK